MYLRSTAIHTLLRFIIQGHVQEVPGVLWRRKEGRKERKKARKKESDGTAEACPSVRCQISASQRGSTGLRLRPVECSVLLKHLDHLHPNCPPNVLQIAIPFIINSSSCQINRKQRPGFPAVASKLVPRLITNQLPRRSLGNPSVSRLLPQPSDLHIREISDIRTHLT